jgi:glycine/D-amino acid oxidase-like deaminating enzyme
MVIKTSFPKDDPTCGWYHTSPQRQPKASHSGHKKIRWTVLGAGYVGLAAARQLAFHYPDDEIVLVEAQEVGFGTSGRNAGFAIDLPHDIGAKDYIGDVNTAQTTLDLNRHGQSLIRDIVRQHGIECQLQECGKYQAAVEDHGIGILNAYRQGLDKLGQDYQMLDQQELADCIGTRFYRQGLFTPGTMLLQPSALVKGLADNLPGNVTLYENTPISGVDYQGKITLTHADGELVTDKLILANNVFGMHFGFLNRSMLPVFLYASLTRQLTQEEQARLGGNPSWGVIPADPYGSTVRRTQDNRILIRNDMSLNSDGLPKSEKLKKCVKKHRRSFENRFPMLADVEFEYTWSGSLALSRNHEGFFGQLAPHVYGSLCHNGLGITRGTASGALLADWIAGKQPGHLTKFLLSSAGPNKLPPEPFLSIGVHTTLWWGQRRAGKEA